MMSQADYVMVEESLKDILCQACDQAHDRCVKVLVARAKVSIITMSIILVMFMGVHLLQTPTLEHAPEMCSFSTLIILSHSGNKLNNQSSFVVIAGWIPRETEFQ